MDRKKTGKVLAVSATAAGVMFIWPVSGAQAYLDPGTGSFIIQAGIAAAAGCILAIKIFWKKIQDFFGGMFGGRKSKKK
ncbi:MAG: hypothetical protein LLG37_06180 [Spirochaetia bacterium]|nr:hypothetical protein [Spirochaetia bacterium]